MGILFTLSSVNAGAKEISHEKLVNWMREINTRQLNFRLANHRYADGGQLMKFAQTKHFNVITSELNSSALAPYPLLITLSPDGMHYQATIIRPSAMNDKATWCKTAVFSDDSGLICLGRNIGCPDESHKDIKQGIN